MNPSVSAVLTTSELTTLVRDDVAGTLSAVAHGTIEERLDLLGGRLGVEHREADASPRDLIDEYGNAPAEGPALGQGQLEAKGPRTPHGWARL